MFCLALVNGLRKGELTLSHSKAETSVRRISIPQEAVSLLVQEHSRYPDNQYMSPQSPVKYTTLIL